MQYLRTRLATDIEPSMLARLLRTIRFPVANPDYDHKLHLVREWLIEFGDDGRPLREIGLDAVGRRLFAGPDARNYGFWLDTNMSLTDFKGEPLTEAEFEAQWSAR
jgi:hypothetical protein